MHYLHRLFRKIFRVLIMSARNFSCKILSRGNLVGNPKMLQPLLYQGNGNIFISENVTLGNYLSKGFFSGYHYFEAREQDSRIFIDYGTHINNNSTIIAEKTSIRIGKNCLIGTDFEVVDSDFHPLSPESRKHNKKHTAKEVLIGNNVFIGSNVKILKGVVIGDGSVIGMGSIVSSSIPKNSIAAGNPAKVISSTKGKI